MTIYKPNKQTDNKGEKLKPLKAAIVTEELLIGKGKGYQDELVARAVMIRRARHRTLMFKACAIALFTFLVFFSLGAGLFVYKHIMNRPYMAVCQARYHDYQQPQKQKLEGSFEEKVELDISHGNYEKLEVPAFLDFRRSTIVHDFEKNLTAIVDRDHGRCYVLPLNRTVIKPPQSFLDMLNKFQSGYYLPNAEILHENYRVATPRVENLEPFGFYIYVECRYFDTYRLVRDNQPFAMSKRASPECSMIGEEYCLGDTYGPYMASMKLTGCF